MQTGRRKRGEAEGFVPFHFEQTRLGPWLCSFARHQFSHVTLNIPNFLICLRQQSDMLGRRMILIICILMELERGPLLLKAKKILSSTFYSEPTRVWWWCVEEFQQKKNNNNSELTRDGFEEQLVVVGFFFPPCVSGGCVIATFLSPTHPSRWIMPGSKRTCVDLWSGLTSSSHVCKWAWLGHCMTMWPCCRFITFLFFSSPVLSSQWRLPPPRPESFLFAKKKKRRENMTRTLGSVSCHAYQVVCRALTFFVSQVRTVKYIQWMIFSRYPLPVVQCNTLETMQ